MGAEILGPVVALLAITAVAWALLKGLYPHAILLLAGMAMLVAARGLGLSSPPLAQPTGLLLFDLFRYMVESFSKTLSKVGLMIMAIGGFVAYMDDIGASAALVRLATKPLRWFSKYPYASSSLVIPLGQLLFLCIPSAAGLGLLLMATVFPLVVNLGVSRLTAVSVIVAATSFGMGPASAVSARAAEILGTPLIQYFFEGQLPLALPASVVMALAFFFVNRRMDRTLAQVKEIDPTSKTDDAGVTAPTYYALLPLLPLVLLLTFSEVLGLVPGGIRLDTSTAMFTTVSLAAAVHAVRLRDPSRSLASLKVFWGGMANIFKSVVTLIIAADIFSKGLISLGFIDALLNLSKGLGLATVGIGIMMTTLIFLASMLMGSGNASFFAFGPLVPTLAAGLSTPSVKLLLPMQLAASMGRSASPISGVVIATAQLAGVSPLAVARRNLIPLGVSLVFLLAYHYAWSS